MAFSKEHVLLTWGGSLPGLETWACSLRCAPMPVVPGAVNISDGDLDGLRPSYVAAVTAFHSAPATGLSGAATLKWVKLAAIDQDGKYKEDQTSVVETVIADVPGGAGFGNAPPPNQVAMAITLVTSAARGRASKGRFFLPLPNWPVNPTDGLIAEAAAIGVRGQVKTFLEAVADVPGIDTDISPTPVVMSQVGAGTTRKIIGCKVGRALDTQRRRRRSLPENYVVSAIDTGVF